MIEMITAILDWNTAFSTEEYWVALQPWQLRLSGLWLDSWPAGSSTILPCCLWLG